MQTQYDEKLNAIIALEEKEWDGSITEEEAEELMNKRIDFDNMQAMFDEANEFMMAQEKERIKMDYDKRKMNFEKMETQMKSWEKKKNDS